MDKFYELANEINSCIANSDAKGLLSALQKLWDLRDMESADAATMFSVYIFNDIFLEHRELLNDPELFDTWCIYNNRFSYMRFSALNSGIFSLEYVKGKLLNSIFLGETENALDMLEKMEKAEIIYDIVSPFLNNESISEKFYFCIIDAAAEYSRPEILKHIADCANTITDMTEQLKIPQYTDFLICRLIDKGYFDILDQIYENTFDSVLVNMTHYISIRRELKHSRVYYIHQLQKRYGKNETENDDENESNNGGKATSDYTPLCRLIDESDVIGGFVKTIMSYIAMDDSLKIKICSELRELVKINFKTDNITALVNLRMMFTMPDLWGNLGNRDQHFEDDDEVLQLIKRLIGNQPVYRVLSVNNIFSFHSHKKIFDDLRDVIKLFGGAISIDNIEKTGFYSEAEIRTATDLICSKSAAKTLMENDLIIMTDPIEENQYINYLIKRKSPFFNNIIKKLSLSKDDLEALIPICTEHGNYSALNLLRKML